MTDDLSATQLTAEALGQVYIPYVYAAVWAAGTSTDLNSVEPVVLDGDTRPYLDLTSVDPEDAVAIVRYYETTQRFWRRLAQGLEPGPYMAGERLLVDARQQSGHGARKVDLRDIYESLRHIPIVSEVVNVMLGDPVDPRALKEIGRHLHIAVDDTGDRTVVDMYVEQQGFDDVLGGPPAPGEVRRHLHIEARRAAWRDRRVRRLVKVQVWAEELWPDPDVNGGA